jgi:hypothetical protein
MMTQDEVLTELRSVIATNQQFSTWTISTPHIVELVNRAIKQEREACAKVCDELPAPDEYSITDKSIWDVTCIDCADAIRARR